ncbi:sodium/proline symporter [Natranaerovirga hydrolytica]|uniref:Sodium/proline symporter n=1 Tax=Natranaerovirga hydrolytica TaxID=680378 RepID=A0A4R1ML43_9FIRM|nr:sodium/proline symporter PutP [Natranaerovirga hydrolytica]TCK92780.1 sodium/proline symporter [Natranaerovirga hydrolytica]
MSDSLIHGLMFAIYLTMLMGIGIHSYKKSKSQSDYFLAGRKLNVWVSSLSAQASDMSGWLLMGLPGTAFLLDYNNGLPEAVWTAIGLAIGTYLNWLFVAKRLRKYSEIANDSITIPTFIENRFRDRTKIIRISSAIFIIIFFLIYTAAQLSAGAKLFNTVFGLDYIIALILGAIVIISYTFLGGFLAVCWTDLIQGILMFFAIIIVPIIALFTLGGTQETFNLVASLSEMSSEFNMSQWTGIGSVGILSIISFAAWGFGYFGQPHILTRFMGISHSKNVKPARRIAMVWVVLTLIAAVLVGVIGKAYLSTILSPESFAGIDPENVFIIMVQNVLSGPVLTIFAGLILTAILSAIMSTADSQLLVTASAVSEDICKTIFKEKISEKQLLWISRLTVLIVSLIALIIAIDPDSSVFDLVAYAWAGFGAAFGPCILLSLYWKRMNWQGALAGILSGGLTVLIWRNVIKTHINLYELVPAFIISVLFIIVVSLLTKKPSKEIEEEFDKVLSADI